MMPLVHNRPSDHSIHSDFFLYQRYILESFLIYLLNHFLLLSLIQLLILERSEIRVKANR